MRKYDYSGPERVRRAREKHQEEVEEYAEAGWTAAGWMAICLVVTLVAFLHVTGWM